jgi:hypothetical protein
MVHCTEIATRLHKTATTMPLSLQQETWQEISTKITEITTHKSTPYGIYRQVCDVFGNLFKNAVIKQLLVSSPNTKTPFLYTAGLFSLFTV